jgi:tripartite-type tricarboxylate transporter receptor subunit TctC
VEYIKEGKLRILYYASPEKLPGYENISCCLDLYGDEFCIPNFLGVMGPRGLPDYVLKKLDDAFAKAVKDPDFISLMKRMYMPVVYMNRDQMNNYVEEGFTRMGRIIKYLESKEKAKGGK